MRTYRTPCQALLDMRNHQQWRCTRKRNGAVLVSLLWGWKRGNTALPWGFSVPTESRPPPPPQKNKRTGMGPPNKSADIFVIECTENMGFKSHWVLNVWSIIQRLFVNSGDLDLVCNVSPVYQLKEELLLWHRCQQTRDWWNRAFHVRKVLGKTLFHSYQGECDETWNTARPDAPKKRHKSQWTLIFYPAPCRFSLLY